MTSGLNRFTSLLVLMLGAASAPAQRGDADWNIAALAQLLQTRPAASARFEETRHIEMLDDPLQLSGTLRYAAPDYVRKEVLKPHHEIFEASGDQLIHESAAHGRQSFSLDEHPAVRAFVEAFRATLGGRLEVLQQYYALRLGGNRDAWSLQLQPLDRDMKKVISTITIHGAGGEVERVETLETGGDLSVMSIHPDSE